MFCFFHPLFICINFSSAQMQWVEGPYLCFIPLCVTISQKQNERCFEKLWALVYIYANIHLVLRLKGLNSQVHPSGSSVDFIGDTNVQVRYLVSCWLQSSRQRVQSPRDTQNEIFSVLIDASTSLQCQSLQVHAAEPSASPSPNAMWDDYRDLPRSRDSAVPLSQRCSLAVVSPFCRFTEAISSQSRSRLKTKQQRLISFFFPVRSHMCHAKMWHATPCLTDTRHSCWLSLGPRYF